VAAWSRTRLSSRVESCEAGTDRAWSFSPCRHLHHTLGAHFLPVDIPSITSTPSGHLLLPTSHSSRTRPPPERLKISAISTTKGIRSTSSRHASYEIPALTFPPAIHRHRGGSLSLETYIPTHDGHPPSHLRVERSQSSFPTSAGKNPRPHAFLSAFFCAITAHPGPSRVGHRGNTRVLSLTDRKAGFRRSRQSKPFNKNRAAALK
jgi:hypothetical protein